MNKSTIWAKYPSDQRYLVSIDGEVINTDWQRRGIVRHVKLSGWRPVVSIEEKHHRVSRMVSQAFHLPGNGKLVCHQNDISNDNRLENLYVGTHTDNINDAVRNGNNPGRGIGITLIINGLDVEYKTIRDAAEAGGHASQLSVKKAIAGQPTSFPYKVRYTDV